MPDCKKGTAAVELPEHGQEAISLVVITETKQKYKSSEDKNSAESVIDLLVPQAKMSAPFDKKLGHLLNYYLYIKRDTHEIWQTFVENDILSYDEFIDTHNLEILKKM